MINVFQQNKNCFAFTSWYFSVCFISTSLKKVVLGSPLIPILQLQLFRFCPQTHAESSKSFIEKICLFCFAACTVPCKCIHMIGATVNLSEKVFYELRLLAYMRYALCDEKLTLQITLNTLFSQSNMLAAASCCGDGASIMY